MKLSNNSMIKVTTASIGNAEPLVLQVQVDGEFPKRYQRLF
jgi:hypothetical protein